MGKPRRRRALPWDEVKTHALDLVFEGRLSQEKIAKDCQTPARTLRDWIAHPDFQAALAERRADLIHSLDHLPYIRKERRLIGLAQMAEHARQEYEAHPFLIERRPTLDGEITNESFNRDAHAAFRGALDDIAKELGERGSNLRVSGNLQHTIVPVGQDLLLARQLLEAVQDLPEAREALAIKLLESADA